VRTGGGSNRKAAWVGRGVLIVVLVLVAAACDWTQYGYGPGHTGYNPTETKIGVGNVASLNLAWTAAVTADATVAVHSSVAVAKGMAYLGVPDVGGCRAECERIDGLFRDAEDVHPALDQQ
jgi:hypothetical protein